MANTAVRNSASAVAERINSARTRKKDQETIAELEDIVNDLVADKAELVRIAQAYEEEFVTQRLSRPQPTCHGLELGHGVVGDASTGPLDLTGIGSGCCPTATGTRTVRARRRLQRRRLFWQPGIEKPDRRLFNIAAAEVGLRAEQLVMVGDSLRNDVQGAYDAGWQGVWLNRDQEAPTGLSATHAITILEHLAALLERLT